MACNRKDLSTWYDQHQLSETARGEIERVRHSPPERRARSGRSNVCVRFGSTKMGHGVQCESRTVEYPFAVMCEFDRDVIEYWDQPLTLKLSYERHDGKKVTHLYTPDFLVIAKREITLVECKPEAELILLAEEHPEKYQKIDDGSWACPPAVATAATLGLSYRIVSSRELSATFTRNCEFMVDYFELESPPMDPGEIRKAIKAFFEAEPRGTLRELLDNIGDADSVYWALAHGYFYLDLHRHLIAAPRSAMVYPDAVYAEAMNVAAEQPGTAETAIHAVQLEPNSELLWDQMRWRIVNVGTTEISLIDEKDNLVNLTRSGLEKLIKNGQIVGCQPVSTSGLDALLKVGKTDLEVGLERARQIEPYLYDEATTHAQKPNRTLRRWIEMFRAAVLTCGIGLMGLVPKTAERGNRTQRLQPEQEEMIEFVIENVYGTSAATNIRSAYVELRALCEQKGITPCSYETLCDRIKHHSQLILIEKRQGKKAAYQHDGPKPRGDVDLPAHGDRAFEVVHIDHTPIEIKVVSSLTGEVLSTLWLTLAIDAYARLILAHFLTFDPPSYRSVMMVLREMVRRHGRWPLKIVVDQGSEFNSIYFEALTVSYGDLRSKVERPASEPRYGSPIERTFGTTQSQFIHMLRGNTKNHRLGRGQSRSHNPKDLAVWTAEDLDERLSDYLYNVYPFLRHHTTGEKPSSRFQRSLQETGLRKHTLIPYDEAFLHRTRPTPKRLPRAKANGLITVNHIVYWSVELARPEFTGKVIDVRYEPFDPSHVYAYVHNQWVRCTSQDPQLRDFSEREIRLAAAELRELRRMAKREYRVTSKEIRDYVLRARAHETGLADARSKLQKRFGGTKKSANQTPRRAQARTKQERQTKLPLLPTTTL